MLAYDSSDDDGLSMPDRERGGRVNRQRPPSAKTRKREEEVLSLLALLVQEYTY